VNWLLFLCSAFANPTLVFVERNSDFHIYHPVQGNADTLRFTFSDLPYISMEMKQIDSVIYQGTTKYDEVPSEIYIETENEEYGSSERIPVEIIPIPSKAFSFEGKNHVPLPIPTKLDLVKLEIQQYKIKAQLAREFKEQQKIENANIHSEEIMDGLVDSK
jgi:hypothetical protein